MTDTTTNVPAVTTTSTEMVTLTPSVRTIARQEDIDLQGLLDILSLRRPDKSLMEENFAQDLLKRLDGAQLDGFGNIYLTIGEGKPTVLWSCHTDTVSKEGGRQNLKWNGDILGLNQGKAGQSLGADDGAGLWLLLEMIKVGKPGLYVFHRAEEVGRLGSKWLSENRADLLEGIKIAIAFDRRGTDSVITFQSGRRTCSEAFAKALGTALGPQYKPDPTGSYTDTYSFVDQIPECTNVSVGYYKEHGPMETLDVAHLFKLRAALLALDASTLPVERDHTKTEYEEDRWGGYGGYTGGYGNYSGFGRSNSTGKSKWSVQQDELDEIERMIAKNPRTFARWFQDGNMSPDVLECMFGTWVRKAAQKPSATSTKVVQLGTGKEVAAPKTAAELFPALAAAAREDQQDEDEVEIVYEPGVRCNDCGEDFESKYHDPQDGDECPQCDGRNTTACEVAIDAISGEVVEVAA